MKNIFKMVDELKVGDEVIYRKWSNFKKGKIQRIARDFNVKNSSSESQYRLFIETKDSEGNDIVMNIGNMYVLPAKAEIRPELAKLLLYEERRDVVSRLLTRGIYFNYEETTTPKKFEYYKNLLKDIKDLIQQYQEWDFEIQLNKVRVKEGVSDGTTQV